MKSFIVYGSHRAAVDMLTDSEAGKLFKGLFQYSADGTLPELEGATQMAFMFLRQALDENTERYERICERNRAAAKKRWGKNADASESIPKDADASESNPADTKECYYDYDNDSEYKYKYKYDTQIHTQYRDMIRILNIDGAWQFDEKARRATAKRLTGFLKQNTSLGGNVEQAVCVGLEYGVKPEEILRIAMEHGDDFFGFTSELMAECKEG